jgi:glycosyltransferase involved in cell wall biosynthesis
MNNPQVSVVMPNYNCARFLDEAIDSILQQTFCDFEFIIIDDGSTDNSWEIIQKYACKDDRIRAFKNERNQHIVYCRNKGVSLSKCDLIAFLDSDDIAFPERLKIQVDYMLKNPDCGVCGSNFEMINEKSQLIGYKKFPENHDAIKKSFFFCNPFGQNTVIVRKKCFNEVGLYNDEYRNAEDLDMWVRIGGKFKLHNIQKDLVKYRVHAKNSMFTSQKRMIRSTLKIRKKAISEYGYAMTFKGQIFYWGTWLAQWLPSKFVFWIFNFLKR